MKRSIRAISFLIFLLLLISCKKYNNQEKLIVDRLIFFSHGQLSISAIGLLPPEYPSNKYNNEKEWINSFIRWREINHWPVYNLVEIKNNIVTIYKHALCNINNSEDREYKSQLTQRQIQKLNVILSEYFQLDSLPENSPAFYNGPTNELYLTAANKKKAFIGNQLNYLNNVFDSLITKNNLQDTFDLSAFTLVKRDILTNLLDTDNSRNIILSIKKFPVIKPDEIVPDEFIPSDKELKKHDKKTNIY